MVFSRYTLCFYLQRKNLYASFFEFILILLSRSMELQIFWNYQFSRSLRSHACGPSAQVSLHTVMSSTIAFVQCTLNFSARYFFIELINGLPWGFYISVFTSYSHWKKKKVGGGSAKCKYLTFTLGTHVFSIISSFFSICLKYLIKIFRFSFPSLLKHPGECWQCFFFIATLCHQILNQCCPIKCLKWDWCI